MTMIVMVLASPQLNVRIKEAKPVETVHQGMKLLKMLQNKVISPLHFVDLVFVVSSCSLLEVQK